MFICGASLLASPRSGKILMVLMCIALCQKLWLSRYSHCCVTRCAPSFVPWRLRTTEPCGDQWFLWWPDRHFHHLMFLYWFLMSDDFWSWFCLILSCDHPQFQSDVGFFDARYFFACSQHWRWCCWAKSKDCTLTEVMLLGLIDIGDGSS